MARSWSQALAVPVAGDTISRLASRSTDNQAHLSSFQVTGNGTQPASSLVGEGTGLL